ncbi:MAG: 50S ribosomal protein L21e [Candidatus Aenigmarchaeota archaeon]|nr:50S ribosomal protein L21e [Candidatus Aenigmarchaeota archaeon]
MVVKSAGFRRRTRRVLKKELRHKFKPNDYLKVFKVGERVAIEPNPSSHKGMPHRRFRGKVGVVVGKRGDAYLIELEDGGKKKTIISNPEHLKLVK